jgi:hypothetical protein
MPEVIFEILGEFLLQVFGEAPVELGFHALAEPFRQPVNSWLAALGYTLFGLILGGLSLLSFPNNLVPEAWRVANPFITPIAVVAWRANHGQTVLRIDRFAYGYHFALSFAMIRFFFTV